MRASTLVVALSVALVSMPAFAQQKPPVQKPPAPAQPAAQAPATQQPPAPFPEGAKIAYVNLQQVFQDSKDGKAARARNDELQNRKLKEIQDKQKLIDANQTLLQSPTLADDKRATLAKEVDRGNTELQRLQQDAQQEVQDLQNDLQNQFARKLAPLAQQMAKEKGLQMILIADPQTIYWADAGLDLSAELTRRLDAAASAPAPAPKAPGSNSSVPPR
jgi:Skp family chaperone for outer membrane proteins